jgi:hypothetical protein
MESSLAIALRDEINSLAPRGADWERDPTWVLQQVKAFERRQAIKTALAGILQFFRRPTKPALSVAHA